MAAFRRLSAGPTRAVEPRLGVALALWPARFGGHGGIAVGAWSGPGVAIDSADLLARFTGLTLFAAARGRLALSRRLAFDAGAGVSLHATGLDGFSPVHRVAARTTRLNTSIDLDAAVAVSLGPRTELALDLAASAALRRQRYLIGGTPVLELPAVELRAGLELRVALR